ncbi:hypothetical protein [Lentzea cavernae]|uniref:Uncharacterized protein n=1 Tax=Lentzea cavernae TaxID=2020703 RepID=A0ABQ3M1W9_9PSEU|nr:hypothetical protein [Lentzea cavernae]GHH29767.1 hypothetical protein GCM10017774_06310 [Lentzea cavernae]
MDKERALPLFKRFGAMMLVAFGILAMTTGVAQAKQTCGSGSLHVICFSIDKVGGDAYAVHVGIDISMSQGDAQLIIDQPGDPVDAWAMGDDWFDNAEFRIPLTWVAAGPDGLSAEFDITVPGVALDEDPDGGDELYARVRLFDQRTSTRTFTSGVLRSPF